MRGLAAGRPVIGAAEHGGSAVCGIVAGRADGVRAVGSAMDKGGPATYEPAAGRADASSAGPAVTGPGATRAASGAADCG
eukprot:14859215-Alexandrium_andersonii.AAC.1